MEQHELFEKLEFDKVLELLKGECMGDVGRVYFDNIPLETEGFLIERKLREVEEFKAALENKDRIPAERYEDIHQDLRMLEVEDAVLPLEAILRIYLQLVITREFFAFFTESRQETYPALYAILQPYTFSVDLVKTMQRTLDEEGQVRNDATPELARIRRMAQSKRRELERQFREVANLYRQKGWLTENVESFRNGRRVLSVMAEHKRKIRGIIHDESATGRTVFIEPEAIIDINNDIFDLDAEEKREIYRILKTLCAEMRPMTPLIRQYQTLIARFDVIRAKARLAVRLNGTKPAIKDFPHLGIREGRHPLLLLKNKETGKETVPFDLVLQGLNRILVVSGPNAGGKTILMKTVGLLQLMVQAGMLIPAHAESEMGIFEHLFTDIGDQQSLEDDLSTYSSRLRNMKHFLDKATDRSLLLIDEFGSGTDPKMGGAIAEALLKNFNERFVFGVITTHYSNIKIFSYKTSGIVNGAMTFDRTTLSPTYQLKIGRPGSSYAFEIADKSGLGKDILDYARHRAGKKTQAVDELLVDLQKEKQEIEEKLAALEDREKKLDRLIKSYEQLARDLEYRRKKFKLDMEQQQLQKAADDNKQLERLMREIREEKNLEKAKAMAQEAKVKREEKRTTVETLQEEIYARPSQSKGSDVPITAGSYVKLRNTGAIGKVERIDRNKAILTVGNLKITAKLRDLVPSGEPLEVNTKKGIVVPDSTPASQFTPRIDIRGMRIEEAARILEQFIDQAILSGASPVRILHGKGSGVLRGLVMRTLKDYKSVRRSYHPDNDQGGDGVTIVEIG